LLRRHLRPFLQSATYEGTTVHAKSAPLITNTTDLYK
jgi:hypothetical protein